jgi:hypothetical protein
MCGGGTWQGVTPSLDNNGHNLIRCSVKRHRRELNGKYQEARRHFGKEESDTSHDTSGAKGGTPCSFVLVSPLRTSVVAPTGGGEVQTQVTQANHRHQITFTDCTIEYGRW